ncbi:maltose/maltodextrin ABC transporter substrate-binding protein MalE [Chromobacterium paludis]|uniref:Maltodextrin-binding protein n=1 Tax=Chromobacterium paludis TaxID=2605945 RepID=A0A5C1DI43_9NEIS|nr:maltose/maltodextrin ABC transporter substrate-binding protein MalE [Chromobacterium paludis]QEL55687.1 maltose/maltodextrin ABC transporter substrate-binding protein MalE [Chromobacterium paludis]
MKITRRQFSRAACLTLSLAVAGAFAAPLAQASGDAKLLIWINGDKGYRGLAKLGEEFTKQTGVKVVVEHPEDAAGKFQQAAAAGKGPDIWIWPHDRLGEWSTAGLLSPVNPSKKLRGEIDDLGWKAFTSGGKTWGYPIALESVALIYNKALVPTPPKTFDEVMALDKKLSASGKKAILWDFTNTYFTWPLLAAGGAYPFKQKADGTYDAKNVGVNHAGAVAGLDTLMKLIHSGAMPKSASYADMEAGVNKGQVAMMISGPWAWENLKKSHIDFGVAPIPSVNGKPAAPFVGVLGAMISAASHNKELATEFIENTMLTPHGLKTINDDVPLGVPASKAFYAQLKSDPNIRATMLSAKAGAPMPNNPEMGKFWSTMQSTLQNVTQGRQGVKAGLDAAAAKIRGN